MSTGFLLQDLQTGQQPQIESHSNFYLRSPKIRSSIRNRLIKSR